MPPPPPPKPSPPSPSSQPKAEATSRPEEPAAAEEGSEKATTSLSMPPPKPSPSPQLDEEAMPSASATENPIVRGLSAEESENPGSGTEMAEVAAAASEQRQQQQQRPRAPYEIPVWSAAPYHAFFLEVVENGVSFGRLDVSKKGVYMFGQIDSCDFVLEHPSISRFHAVLQFRKNGEVFLYDIESEHGSFINMTRINKRVYMKINVGDIISFGKSPRMYTFEGPSELMPLDGEGKITCPTNEGQLTDRQENTYSKITKRMEEVANLEKEICAISAIDISQAGGLTQGQQTRFTYIKQRITQIMEEVKNLEETLNDSIQGSPVARDGKPNCGSHRPSIEEDAIFGGQQSVEMDNSLLEKKDIISGTKSERKLVEEDSNYQKDDADLHQGCNRGSIQRKPSSLTTIHSLPEDTILEIFLRLPSIGCVIRAACSCSVWKNAVSSSPKFRRKFLDLCPAPLLGLFFDPPSNIAPAFPVFVPARNSVLDVPVAVRWGDFFITELQRQPFVPPNWILSDVRGGLMLLVNRNGILLVVDPLQGRSEGYFDQHEVRILMDYHGINPRILQAHLVCDEAYTGRFTLICFAHDVSRVRVAVFRSTGGSGFLLPWFEVAPRQNQLDEDDGWLIEGVQAGESIYWLSRNYQYVVVLNTKTLLFSVEYPQDLNLNDLDSYAFGATRNGRLCLSYFIGPRLVVMCCQSNNSVSGPWEILHEALLQDLAFNHGELRVAGIRKGIVYIMASRIFHQYGIPCWVATYDMRTHEVEVKCQYTSMDLFQPFYLPWPRSLSSQGQSSAEKAQKLFQKFEKMNVVKDIALVKAIYSCQIDVMKNPHDYKSWCNYINLEKELGDKNKVKHIYEQALSNVPVEEEKWFWEGYISLWLSFAIYEEEEAGNIESAREVYARCLGVIPHQRFTFSAVWTMAADFEMRQKDVEAARQILRAGIEKHRTAKMYKKLIDIEYWMNNHGVWRGLFEAFIEWLPMNCRAWMEYAEMEHNIGEVERARAVYERAIQQPSLDLPIEVLLKDCLYFEISEGNVDNARALFEKLLIVTKDVEA